jgi:hypothetical protein
MPPSAEVENHYWVAQRIAKRGLQNRVILVSMAWFFVRIKASTGKKNKMANLLHPSRGMPLLQLMPNRPHYHTLFIPAETRAILVVDGINQGVFLFRTKLLPNLASPDHMPSLHPLIVRLSM